MTDPVQFNDTTLCDLARRMVEAEQSRDAEFFQALLAETLTFRRANGDVVDKTTFLKDLRNSANTYEMLESEDISATIQEGVAVVTLLVRASGMREGKPFAGVFRNIRIFVHEPDKQQPWQLHAWFNVRVAAERSHLGHQQPKAIDSKAKRQAVVIIHGIGEQRPMETLRAFVAGALGVEKEALKKFVFSKPDRIDDTLELRRLSVSTRENVKESPLEKSCETDFYELYWQHLMQNTSWLSVRGWIIDLVVRPKLPCRLRGVRRWVLGLIAAGIVAIAALGMALWLYLDGSPLWQSAAKPVIFSASLAGVLGWLAQRPLKRFVFGYAERFFLGYVGDAARYLTPDPPNIKARRDIRNAGLTLLRGLHEDELRRYERIILVGHSLGSVIAYDLITWFWQEQHHRLDLEYCTGKRKTAVMRHAEPKPGNGNIPNIPPLDELADPCSPSPKDAPNEFPSSQRSLWQKLRDRDHLPWRITDLVTLGSPLAHADVLLAESRKAFRDGKSQREFPTCPPKCEDCRDDGLLGRTYEDKQGAHYVHILHHGAPFAVTRWTNLYFPGDIVGGPVARLFGKGIKDVELCPVSRGWLDGLIPARSHTRYWDPLEDNASEELVKALDLNDFELPTSDRPPVKSAI
jgi:hypothetical protein